MLNTPAFYLQPKVEPNGSLVSLWLQYVIGTHKKVDKKYHPNPQNIGTFSAKYILKQDRHPYNTTIYKHGHECEQHA